MTVRYAYEPLRRLPPQALAALHAQVVALLRFSDALPADLSVKLDLLRDDISAVLGHSAGDPAARRSPAFTPHPAAWPGECPAASAPPRAAISRVPENP